MKVYDFEQYTPEWWQIRLGIPTASCFDRIITPKTKKPSKSAQTYAYELAGELLAGFSEESYANDYMDRGTALESEARNFYELVHDVEVRQVGFCMADNYGCSPDGLIGDDGGLEIKCPKMTTHVMYLHKDNLVQSHYPQVQGALLVTGRKWWDIMSYYPGLEPVIRRVTPDKEYLDILKPLIDRLVNDVETITKEIKRD